jgi:sigma-B regulation protein RsbU (phosphoserine phosphatase)
MRLEQELAEARAFQQSLLPPERGQAGDLLVFARYWPCSELGGDFYDYATTGQGGATLLLADVSGHGATAAMLTGVVKSAFHSASIDGYEPLSVVRRVASGIRAFGYERFITLACVRISTAQPWLEYVNAGHPPGIVWGNGGTVNLLEATGPLISPAFPDSFWKQGTLRLERQDRLLLFSDGVEDSGGGEGFFGLERILHEVTRNPEGGDRLLDQILHSVRQFSAGRPIQDDLTLLTANF